jgi:exodeoxyribonuclease VII large subunit
VTHPPERDVYTVSRLNREVAEALWEAFPLLWVEGEISNLARPRSGHLYFTLKDEQAQVRCAMFRNRNRFLDFAPAEGMHVLVRARVGLYEARGDFQLTVEHMEEVGAGALYREFERLKRRLAAEGLFDEAAKKPLPAFPRAIGVVTSPSGAAVRDILNVLKRRWPQAAVYVYAASVQGDLAPAELRAALERATRDGRCDVLILARGGGSIEDLWAFNDEALARAIHAAEIPIVTGIGHEIDFTIADFVADRRAPTPSAAAELVAPDRGELRIRIDRLAERLFRGIVQRLRLHRHRLEALQARLAMHHPQRRLEEQARRLDDLERRLTGSIGHRIQGLRHRLDTLQARLAAQSPGLRLQPRRSRLERLEARLRQGMERRLHREAARLERLGATLRAMSPQATLDRGYAIVTTAEGGKLVRAHEDLQGDRVDIRLAHERLHARVSGWEPAE